jgi:hypothetical protein
MRTDPRTKAALRRLIRHRTIAAKALAEDLGVAYRTLMSWLEPEGVAPSLDQVRQLVKACARYNQAEARRLAEDLFGIGDCGWFVAVAPRAAGVPADVVHEVLEAGAAVGLVTGWAVEASAGGISPEEAAEGCRLIGAAERELAETRAAVQCFQAPQLNLAGVSP